MRIAYSKSQVSVSSSTFTENSAASNGGGMYTIASAAALDKVKMTSNKAEIGGALYTMSRVDASQVGKWADQLFSKELPSLVTCKACTLESNLAVKGGGFAVMGQTAKAALEDTFFRSNEAVGDSSCGAGMVIQTTVPLQLTGQILFEDNRAARDGGGLCVYPRPEAGGVTCPRTLQLHPFMMQVCYTYIYICVCVCIYIYIMVYAYL
jgi:hypothetical protein